jgi:hypothetical protein
MLLRSKALSKKKPAQREKKNQLGQGKNSYLL